MSKKLTLEEFIERANRVHNNRYDYSLVDYKGYRNKVDILCKTHGLFSQTVSKHLSGQGCSKCSRDNYTPKNKLTQTEFIEKSRTLFPDRYDYTDVMYKDIKSKVVLRCMEHNFTFEQTASQHLLGSIICPECLYRDKNYHSKGYWTLDRATKVAKKYKWVGDFKKNDYRCYTSCVRLGYLKHFTWLKRSFDENDNLITTRNYVVYIYEFPEYNSVYIGLTINPQLRHGKHKKEGTVFKFCQDKGVDLPEMKILESELNIREVGDREDCWIDCYKEQGYNLLNKKKGGSLGVLNSKIYNIL